MAPLLKRVERAGIKGLLQKRNPMAVTPAMFFEDTEKLRAEYARLLKVSQPQRVVIIPSVSYGLANVARNLVLRPGDQIVVTAAQFPSNVYPWMRVTDEAGAKLNVIQPPAELKDRGKRWNERILDSINSQTRLVALAHIHWADGTRFDLAAIRKRTREVGALLVIDGTQSVGAMPFDMKSFDPDALICAGYKWLMGPYSIGLAYYGPYFDQGKPVEENWINRLHSEDFTGLVNYQHAYQPGALRYEVGEHSNFILVPMMLEALRQVNEWTPVRIQQYTEKISREALAMLREAGCWIEEEYRGNHLLGVRLPDDISLEKVKAALKKNKISVSVRGDSIRVSPHLYNTSDDMKLLARTILTAR
ncbi:MAG: aminotransferase class V-fold PLP-dependent enzyme [Cyclobacteriaceae bacterium]|jgi:selenocysteine lyase/cysteine desulfurase